MIKKILIFILAIVLIIIIYYLIKFVPVYIQSRKTPEYLKINCPSDSICIQNPKSIK